ncbi:MAG: hypothetical protein HW405_735 [Candidatus Berkelbacteria bacterium]|nr:hypothetical protein [Candidatus Berkelbacteria bacterium]
MNNIENSILKTLAFDDIFDRPLLLDEIWRFLYKTPASKLQVFMGIKTLLKKEKIQKATSEKSQNIYYYLAGKEKIVQKYFQNFVISQKHLKKVSWIINILRKSPFIKNISVINSLSFNTSNVDSDIDILIVAKKGKLWTARAITILLLEIMGQNKNKWYKAGKFCVGFAFDETRLNLTKIRFKKDIYFTHWLANLIPVYDQGIYKNLIEKNSWIKEELPNWEEKEVKIENSKLGILEKLLTGKFGKSLENWLAKIQINRILKDPENHRKGASVIADESMMKLHAYDKRNEYQKDWEAKYWGLTKKEKLR